MKVFEEERIFEDVSPEVMRKLVVKAFELTYARGEPKELDFLGKLLGGIVGWGETLKYHDASRGAVKEGGITILPMKNGVKIRIQCKVEKDPKPLIDAFWKNLESLVRSTSTR